jgi:hypothetical protein
MAGKFYSSIWPIGSLEPITITEIARRRFSFLA